MDRFEIRVAQRSDGDVLSALLRELGYETPPPKIAALLSNPASERHETVVGVMAGAVVAVMSMIYFDYFPSAEKYCRITAIVVRAKHQGQGVGTQLLDYAKVRALANQCQVLEVTTSLKRQKTQEFYEKSGFDQCSYKYVLTLDSQV